MEVIYIAIAAFIGGAVAALLGYLEKSKPFDVKKFLASMVRSVFAAAGFAAAFNYAEAITAISFMTAFLGGAGVDVLGNRISGAMAARAAPSK